MTAKKLCSHHKRMVPIVGDLWLSECCSYGRLTNQKGAIETARALVERQGGIARMRQQMEDEEDAARRARKSDRDERYSAERRRYVER